LQASSCMVNINEFVTWKVTVNPQEPGWWQYTAFFTLPQDTNLKYWVNSFGQNQILLSIKNPFVLTNRDTGMYLGFEFIPEVYLKCTLSEIRVGLVPYKAKEIFEFEFIEDRYFHIIRKNKKREKECLGNTLRFSSRINNMADNYQWELFRVWEDYITIKNRNTGEFLHSYYTSNSPIHWQIKY